MGKEVHRIAVELRPTSLDDLGLVPALSAYVEEWGQRTRTLAEFEVTGLPQERLPSLLETTIYRIVQEALNNAAKYAVPKGATHVTVTLQGIHGEGEGEGQVQAVVEDNGPGFDLEEAMHSGRLGLVGMRERAELIGGTVEIESAPGEGTTVFLRLPLTGAAASAA